MEPSRPWPGSVDRLVDMLAARSCLSWPPCHKKGGRNKATAAGPEMEEIMMSYVYLEFNKPQYNDEIVKQSN